MGDVKFIPNPLLEQQWNASAEAAALMSDIGGDVADRARARAPRRTGALAASIRVDVDRVGGSPTATIGADVSYAGFVEFGTSRQAAEPFLRPALDEVV